MVTFESMRFECRRQRGIVSDSVRDPSLWVGKRGGDRTHGAQRRAARLHRLISDPPCIDRHTQGGYQRSQGLCSLEPCALTRQPSASGFLNPPVWHNSPWQNCGAGARAGGSYGRERRL